MLPECVVYRNPNQTKRIRAAAAAEPSEASGPMVGVAALSAPPLLVSPRFSLCFSRRPSLPPFSPRSPFAVCIASALVELLPSSVSLTLSRTRPVSRRLDDVQQTIPPPGASLSLSAFCRHLVEGSLSRWNSEGGGRTNTWSRCAVPAPLAAALDAGQTDAIDALTIRDDRRSAVFQIRSLRIRITTPVQHTLRATAAHLDGEA